MQAMGNINDDENRNTPTPTVTQEQFHILLPILEEGDSWGNDDDDVDEEEEIATTQGSDSVTLDDWISECLGGDVNQDVLVEMTTDRSSSHSPNNRKRPPDNYGSLLLVACEMNFVEGVKALIRRGANVNYRHPASHGNCPLLRCAEMGYTECLQVLISHGSDIDVAVETKEYKLVLGQTFPQYEAGGRSALLLAIENCHPDVVRLLLTHLDCEHNLPKRKDSFGRTPLEAAFEIASMKDPLTPIHGVAIEIARILCKEMMSDFQEASKALMLEKSVAMSRWRKRNIELRQRFLLASHLKRKNEREKSLAIIQERYSNAGLRLHSDVYESKFPSHATALPTILLEDLEHDSSHGTEKMKGLNFLEPTKDVFHFPLLKPDYCAKIYEELLRYEEVASARPELDLPYFVRHDGNFGSLEDCGFGPLLQAIEKEFVPLVKKPMPDKGECHVYHAFLKRDWVEREENSTFKIHCDKSDITFNICLEASSDLTGSTVGFYDNPPEPNSEGEIPNERQRRHTLSHRVGYAVMHGGTSWHKTDPITKGSRASIIVWARWAGQPCKSCGASMGATWPFCKACGKEAEGR